MNGLPRGARENPVIGRVSGVYTTRTHTHAHAHAHTRTHTHTHADTLVCGHRAHTRAYRCGEPAPVDELFDDGVDDCFLCHHAPRRRTTNRLSGGGGRGGGRGRGRGRGRGVVVVVAVAVVAMVVAQTPVQHIRMAFSRSRLLRHTHEPRDRVWVRASVRACGEANMTTF